MGKLRSLLKASMTEGMQLFRFKKGKKNSRALVVLMAMLLASIVFIYANMQLDALVEGGMGFVVLTLYALIMSVLTLIEGAYKAGGLLFNCKDDDLMFSLPIKRSTILFVRMFKFYLFELLYSALCLIPTMVAYAIRIEVDATFYIASVAAVIFLPVIPIVIGAVVGWISTSISSRFRFKNIIQIIITSLFTIAILVAANQLDSIISEIAKHATSINDFITKLYYPVGVYISMVTDFNVWTLLGFCLINAAIFAVFVLLFGKYYFKTNSRAKIVKNEIKNKKYVIKTTSVKKALIKKELKRFINTPVFVVNAAFGLILFIIGCCLLSFNRTGIVGMIKVPDAEIPFDLAMVFEEYAPLILFSLIACATMMSSITSSMISLEGKAFNILKTIPTKPTTIIFSKVATAVLIMMPFIIIGDAIVLVRFDFSVLQVLLVILASVLFPVVAELFGIIFNLKYPKMNAESDAEVVKQSASTTLATFFGMGFTAVVWLVSIILVLFNNVAQETVLAGGVGILILLLIMQVLYLKKIGVKKFLSIEA